VEPLCFGMDIKKHTNSKTAQKNWEIDSVLDKIEVTLGQKDLSMITSIYTDNIGEAKLVDLLPEQIRYYPLIYWNVFKFCFAVLQFQRFSNRTTTSESWRLSSANPK